MKTKVAITIDDGLVRQVDQLVRDARFPNRSRAIEFAVAEHLERVTRRRLARECARLEATEEAALADEGLVADVVAWPPY